MRPAMLDQPARHERFRRFLDPLVDQSADLSSQISGVVKPAELKTFEGSSRGFPQILKIRQHSWCGHV